MVYGPMEEYFGNVTFLFCLVIKISYRIRHVTEKQYDGIFMFLLKDSTSYKYKFEVPISVIVIAMYGFDYKF